MNEPALPIIIIPTYRPDGRLPALIDDIRVLGEFPIVVVDDGSDDGYARFYKGLRRTGCTVLTHREKKGCGAALKTGIHHAAAHYPISIGYIVVNDYQLASAKAIVAVAQGLDACANTVILEGASKPSIAGALAAVTLGMYRAGHPINPRSNICGIPAICGEAFLQIKGDTRVCTRRFLRAMHRRRFPISDLRACELG